MTMDQHDRTREAVKLSKRIRKLSEQRRLLAQQRRALMIDLNENGMTQNKIAENLGLTEHTVWKEIRSGREEQQHVTV